MPSALRENVRLGFGPAVVAGRRATHREQVLAEYEVVALFLRSINEFGHRWPPEMHFRWAEGKLLDDKVRQAATVGDVMWPTAELIGALALAQHHGIPTRLLDWSRTSRIAAYFAAELASRWLHDGFPGGEKVEKLCVWACHAYAERLCETPESALRFLTVPQEYNPNLRAQRGMFTLHRQKTADPKAPPAAQAVDELLAERIRESPGNPRDSVIPNAILRQMTLPVEQAPALLSLLRYEGVTAGTLFPTVDGVVQDLLSLRYMVPPSGPNPSKT
jgi:hypothetical protein